MRRNQLVMLAGILTIAIAGCATEEAPPPVTTAPVPTPATTPVPVAPARPGQAATTPPLVTERPAPAPAVPGLIPSTNAQEREKQVRTEIRTGRGTDPFSALPPDLPKPATTRPVPNVAQLPTNRPGATGGTGETGGPGGTGTAPVRPGRNTAANPRGGGTAQPPKEVATPAIPKVSGPLGVNLPPTRPATAVAAAPSTDTAEGVEVTGVVVVGSTPQAIVIAPGEGTSRYVAQGQRIAGGRVLVKRIDATGAEPVVILEENGVEVARSVGEKPPQPANAKPAA
ncbi:MAG: hypothetical protein NW220_14810 [Leptolyngbyaceae cyanobacterium bins.349]|nr:hypothetical protein [Leptolyngbyaceae cyanobacterium bins.349]